MPSASPVAKLRAGGEQGADAEQAAARPACSTRGRRPEYPAGCRSPGLPCLQVHGRSAPTPTGGPKICVLVCREVLHGPAHAADDGAAADGGAGDGVEFTAVLRKAQRASGGSRQRPAHEARNPGRILRRRCTAPIPGVSAWARTRTPSTRPSAADAHQQPDRTHVAIGRDDGQDGRDGHAVPSRAVDRQRAGRRPCPAAPRPCAGRCRRGRRAGPRRSPSSSAGARVVRDVLAGVAPRARPR